MKLTKEELALLQKFLANDMERKEAEQFEKKLETDKSMQDAKKIIDRIPEVSHQYYERKERAAFDKMYEDVRREEPYPSPKIIPFFSSNIRKIAAILLIGVLFTFIWGFNYLHQSNQQLAANNFDAVQQYYNDLESERGSDDSKEITYLNALEENYTLGKESLNSQNYIIAIDKFNTAYDLAVKEQNPLQYEIKLLLALSHLGNDDSATATTMLKELIEQQQIPSSLQSSINALLNRLEWKQKLPF